MDEEQREGTSQSARSDEMEVSNSGSPLSYTLTPQDPNLSNISETSMTTTNSAIMETNDLDNDSYEVVSQDENRAMEIGDDTDMAASRPAKKSQRTPSPLMEKSSGFSSDEYQVLAERHVEFVIPDWENCVRMCQGLEQATNPKPASLGTEEFERDLRSSGRIVSESIPIGEHRWRLLVCPAGNQGTPREEVAVFVELQGELPGDTAVCAQMCIGVRKGEKVLRKPANHRFDTFERDWGFSQFAMHRQLIKDDLIASDGSLTFFLSLRVVKDELGTLWHNFINYNSKRATGFVGLQNQGATCYMNSLLQSLYLTNAFRKMVYSIPTLMVNPNDSIPHALQRVFYRLQTLDSPVGTTELTKSFGWDTLDAFMQHDVQEFSRVLLDDLEEKMKGTPVEGALERLFVGKMQNVIKCLEVDYQSLREESFYDLQLAVKGMQTLEDSFREYIKPEMMHGSNKYHAEQHGLQDAKRFVAFRRFPPVLHCHLVRYTFDPETGDIAKFNGRLAFPTRLSLGQFLSEDVPEGERQSRDNDYLLHSVLVHSGDSHGGHYFVFVKDFARNKWFKFDDTRVTPVTEREAVDDNFGGEQGEESSRQAQQLPRRPGPALLKRFTNAYMLVYVRESELETIMAEVTEEDIPPHVPQGIRTDDEAEERRRVERQAQLQACPVYVLDDALIGTHRGFDLHNTDPEHGQPLTIPARLDMRKDDTFGRLRAVIGRHLGLYTEDAPPETIDRESRGVHIWTLAGRKNRTTRVDQCITADDRLLGQFAARMPSVGGSAPPLMLYATLNAVPSQGSFLVWFKFISRAQHEDPLTPSHLSMLTLPAISVSPKECIRDHLGELSRRAGVEVSLEGYSFYEELKPGRVDALDPLRTFAALELRGGDIVAFGGKDVNVPDYYEDLMSRIGVDLVKRGGSAEKKVQVALSLKMSGQQACEVAAQALTCPPNNLRLFLAERGTDYPTSTAVKRDVKLADQLHRNINRPTHAILYYEVLAGVSASDVDGLHALSVTMDGSAKQVYVPVPTTIKEVFERADADREEHILLEIYNHKISLFFSYSDTRFSTKPAAEYKFVRRPTSVASLDTASEGEGSVCIPLFHYYRECSIPHSDPMLVPLLPKEHFSELQRRVIELVARPEEQHGDIEVNFVFYGRVMPLSREEVLAERSDIRAQWRDCSSTGVMVQIGVNHTPPSRGILSPRAVSGERTGIRIKK